jgi:amino acid transporter
MKYTGWAVIVIGLLIGLFGLFAFPGEPAAATPGEDATTPTGQPFPMGPVLLGFAAVAMAAGIGMLVFGGSGVIKTKNLAVRR